MRQAATFKRIVHLSEEGFRAETVSSLRRMGGDHNYNRQLS